MSLHPNLVSATLRLTLQYGVPDCAQAKFSHLSITVWQREPVTVEAMVRRLEAKLGAARLSLDPTFHTLRHEWTTGPGTTIGIHQWIGEVPPAHPFSISLAQEQEP